MAYTSNDFTALLYRTMDPAWLDALSAHPEGVAVLNMLRAIAVKQSQVVDDGTAMGAISTASGGMPGTCVLTFTVNLSIDPFTVPQGYPFVTASGLQLVTPIPLTFTGAPLTFDLPLITVRKAEVVNSVTEPFTLGVTADQLIPSTAPTVIDAGFVLVLGPKGGATADATLTACTPIRGGASDWLSLIGSERGTLRQSGEETIDYRRRVRELTDVASPKAISLAVNGIAPNAQMDPVWLAETMDGGEDAATKAAYHLTQWQPGFCALDLPTAAPADATDFYDDAAYTMVGRREARAYFELRPRLPFVDADLTKFFTDEGFLDDPVAGFLDAGMARSFSTAFAIWQEANLRRAGGVQMDVLGYPCRTATDYALVNAGAPVLAFTLTPAVGYSWLLVDGLVGVAIESTTAVPYYYLVFVFTDATTFTTPTWTARTTQRLTTAYLNTIGYPIAKHIASVGCWASSTPAVNVHVSASLFVLDFLE